MAAGPKEERINLEHEHDDDDDDKEELAKERSGGAPPPKVSPIWLVLSPRCSLNAKMSTCAKVTGRHKSSARIMVCSEMCSDPQYLKHTQQLGSTPQYLGPRFKSGHSKV